MLVRRTSAGLALLTGSVPSARCVAKPQIGPEVCQRSKSEEEIERGHRDLGWCEASVVENEGQDRQHDHNKGILGGLDGDALRPLVSAQGGPPNSG